MIIPKGVLFYVLLWKNIGYKADVENDTKVSPLRTRSIPNHLRRILITYEKD